MKSRSLRTCVLLATLLAFGTLQAQDAASTDAAPVETEATNRPVLSDTQQAIKVRFDRFEETLFKMARYLQKTEPARAELVLRALGRSKEERVAERMTLISRMLSKEESGAAQYADAIEEQDAVLANIRELLTILRSEDILDENRKEQERLKELARQVAALIDAEKVHQADTRRGTPTDQIAKGQERTAKRTGDVVDKIDAHDRAGDERDTAEETREAGEKSAKDDPAQKDSSEKNDDPRNEGSESSENDGKPNEGDQSGKPKAGEEQKPGEGDDSKSNEQNGAEPQDGKPGSESRPKEGQQGQPSQRGESGEQGEQSESSNEQSPQSAGKSQRSTPGREELEAAREKMERVIDELKQQNRENASKEQEEAIRKLIQAKERIDELLRQLREEERELLLRSLEARFQKMLQLQEAVLATTERLTAIPNEKWTDREFSLCRDAASTEREIAMEAEKALEVMRADGSSVAFPEAVEQIGTDIGEVASRLGREDAGELTVAIEQEIIDALKEMIEAFQKEMEKLRQQKGQSGGQQGSPSEPGLVDKLAELKMLKTLQLRINRRTKTLGSMFTGEQATEPDVVGQLRELSVRQSRLQRATYDLATGKTVN